MGKPFTQLVKDLFRGAAETARLSATQMTHEIQRESPYWDGYFANEWVVRQGDVNIPAVYDGVQRSEFPQKRDITYATIPAPKRVGDAYVYTVGNQMKYRDIALDIVPGRRAEGNRLNYVPKGWFEAYVKGGNQVRVMQQATNRTFRSLGFR